MRTAAERYGDGPAARFQRDGEWVQWTYNELWDRVREFALGLIALGVDVGDRVCILANTRVEFTVADLAASSVGAVVVPVYPSNSADECQWVVGNSGATRDRLRERRAGGEDRLRPSQPPRPAARRDHRWRGAGQR